MSTKRNSDRRATTIRIWKGDVVLDDGARASKSSIRRRAFEGARGP